MFWLVIGCALNFQHRGLLVTNGRKMKVVSSQGKTVRIIAGSDRKYLHHLDGCGVKTQGVKVPGFLFVSNWEVEDAGDGSSPYLGSLSRRGFQWFIEDIQTGSFIEVLSDDEDLADWIGQPIMVVGFVTGPHQVKAMYWKPLGTQPLN
jgi:hypothetical protein